MVKRKYGLTHTLTGRYHLIAPHKGVQIVKTTPRKVRDDEFPISYCGIVLTGLTNIKAAGVTGGECRRCDVSFHNYQLLGEMEGR